MKRASIFAALALILPGIAFAQQAVTTVQNLFESTLGFINGILVPIIFAVAFLFFLWGVYRYFIAGGANEEKVKEGQKFVMWSILGFVLMFSLWGIINILINTLGFGGSAMPGLPTFSGGFDAGGILNTSGSGNLFGGSGGNLFGGLGATTGNTSGNIFKNGATTYTSGGVSYPITGANTVKAVNGSCPINFLEISNGECQNVNAGLGGGNVPKGGSCTTDGQCNGDLACSSSSHTCIYDPSLDAQGYAQGNGTVQQGGTCKTGADCMGNLTCSQNDVCIVDSQLEGAGYGTGAGEVLQGGACQTNNDCAGNLICTNGACAMDSQLEAGNGTLGSACQVDSQCDSNYQCLNAVCSQPTSLGQQGDACTSDSDCYGNLACLPPTGSNRTCQYDSSLDPNNTYTNSGSTDTNYCCADGSSPYGTGSCNDGSQPYSC